ncbi:MAG TPA: methyltransferase domain-containing protein [Terriglobia bacterium]|nr:methyltransferase domain-containing protein [Terriglobia bacterium]
MGGSIDLSVIIPALREGPNLALLLPLLRGVLNRLGIPYEILVITREPDVQTREVTAQFSAKLVEQTAPGYGGALLTGFANASGAYWLTMDADLSHQPDFIAKLWGEKEKAEVSIASRYVKGGTASMPALRFVMSRTLNFFFSRGLDLPFRDMSSGFRLYKSTALRGETYAARNFAILQEILVRGYAQGWKIQEIPFHYAPRQLGKSKAQLIGFAWDYLKALWSLWRLRNSIESADYDSRAYDSIIFIQRYWQRSRFRHITQLIAGEGRVLDVGCGSSRIIGALPPGSVALDILLRKLRFARKYSKHVVQGTGFALPFPDASFPCVLSSQMIEHVPKEPQVLDELCRVLAPGGRLILGTPDYANWEWVITEKIYEKVVPGGYAHEHISHYTRRELIDTFEKRGFKLEDTRYILKGELILAFRKPRAG